MDGFQENINVTQSPRKAALNELPPEASLPRITIISKIFHQVPGGSTTSAPTTGFFRWLGSDEQPYTRTEKVEQEWKKIDSGWLKDKPCSIALIINSFKRQPSTNPTEEEKELLKANKITLGIKLDDGSILELSTLSIGEDTRLMSPHIMDRLYVRSVIGESKYTIFLAIE